MKHNLRERKNLLNALLMTALAGIIVFGTWIDSYAMQNVVQTESGKSAHVVVVALIVLLTATGVGLLIRRIRNKSR